MNDLNQQLLIERFGDIEKLNQERYLPASQISKHHKSE